MFLTKQILLRSYKKVFSYKWLRRFQHHWTLQEPVMKNVVTDIFPASKEKKVYVDFTFGAGGHTKILLNTSENNKVFALDRDPESYHIACGLRNEYPKDQIIPLLGRFSDLPALFLENNVSLGSVDGILLEAGPSTIQLQNPNRGFDCTLEGPLDMRMDLQRIPNIPTAMDVINTLGSFPLAQIFKKYGQEKQSQKIAEAIVDARFMNKHIETTSQLSTLVAKIIGSEYRPDIKQRRIPSCHQVFTSLRMFVNNELNELNYALHIAFCYLKPGGKLLTITYDPLEDHIIKDHLMGIHLNNAIDSNMNQKYINPAVWHSTEDMSNIMTNKWTILHRKVEAKIEEISLNPKSEFAKLRVACKTDKNQQDKKQNVIKAELIF